MHTGRGVVVREFGAVLQVALVELSGATRCILGKWHVLCGGEALIAGPVESSAEPACAVVFPTMRSDPESAELARARSTD